MTHGRELNIVLWSTHVFCTSFIFSVSAVLMVIMIGEACLMLCQRVTGVMTRVSLHLMDMITLVT